MPAGSWVGPQKRCRFMPNLVAREIYLLVCARNREPPKKNPQNRASEQILVHSNIQSADIPTWPLDRQMTVLRAVKAREYTSV